MFSGVPGARLPGVPINAMLIRINAWRCVLLKPEAIIVLKSVHSSAARFVKLKGLKTHGCCLGMKMPFSNAVRAVA